MLLSKWTWTGLLLFVNPGKSDVKHLFFERAFVLVARNASLQNYRITELAELRIAPVLQCFLAHLQEYYLLFWGVPVVEGRFRECMVNSPAGLVIPGHEVTTKMHFGDASAGI
jgi:hypothetical protein